jgi:pyridoxine/pyridoxamine 5'-phosphate oxidase
MSRGQGIRAKIQIKCPIRLVRQVGVPLKQKASYAENAALASELAEQDKFQRDLERRMQEMEQLMLRTQAQAPQPPPEHGGWRVVGQQRPKSQTKEQRLHDRGCISASPK